MIVSQRLRHSASRRLNATLPLRTAAGRTGTRCVEEAAEERVRFAVAATLARPRRYRMPEPSQSRGRPRRPLSPTHPNFWLAFPAVCPRPSHPSGRCCDRLGTHRCPPSSVCRTRGDAASRALPPRRPVGQLPTARAGTEHRPPSESTAHHGEHNGLQLDGSGECGSDCGASGSGQGSAVAISSGDARQCNMTVERGAGCL